MTKYTFTREVTAEPMTYGEAVQNNFFIPIENENEKLKPETKGYHIISASSDPLLNAFSYTGWCSADIFEKYYKKTKK